MLIIGKINTNVSNVTSGVFETSSQGGGGRHENIMIARTTRTTGSDRRWIGERVGATDWCGCQGNKAVGGDGRYYNECRGTILILR